MKRIKDLKKQLIESEKVSDIFQRVHELTKELSEIKKQAEEVHRSLQTTAKKSQEDHIAAIGMSKEIVSLRKQERDSFNKFIEKKEEFKKIEAEFRAKLEEYNKIISKFKREKIKKQQKRIDTIKNKISKKQQEIEEKMKKGGKLTNEDLIYFQNMPGSKRIDKRQSNEKAL